MASRASGCRWRHGGQGTDQLARSLRREEAARREDQRRTVGYAESAAGLVASEAWCPLVRVDAVAHHVGAAQVEAGGVERLGHERRDGDADVGVAQRPLQHRAHPVAVGHVRLHDALGPRQPAEGHHRGGITRPVGGMEDLDAVAADVASQPDEVEHRRRHCLRRLPAADRGVVGLDPEPDRSDVDVVDLAERLVRRRRRIGPARGTGDVDLVGRRIEVGQDLGLDPRVGPEGWKVGGVDGQDAHGLAAARRSEGIGTLVSWEFPHASDGTSGNLSVA